MLRNLANRIALLLASRCSGTDRPRRRPANLAPVSPSTPDASRGIVGGQGFGRLSPSADYRLP
jgi:hypothetical protein